MRSNAFPPGPAGPLVAVMVAASVLAGCTHGTKQDHTSSTPPRSTIASPTATHTQAAATLTAQCHNRARAGGKPIIFRGNSSSDQYCGLQWSSDVIRDCPTHAHGAKMIAFLKTHKCNTTGRTLATIFVRGDAINVSSIATSITGTAQNPLGPV